ncbi:hypothetical protein P879_11026 [Paragonimus westermani]|uniref:Phosphatidic acid phosphatase type 2/haloperoxidase domain-containing protein n=1 Tax=Paragonimus westermani TaxID=34504 RepID=A0A8T0D345_9TREM|nr:hypothetical protein P879_11026 [Paragonimus westermani]
MRRAVSVSVRVLSDLLSFAALFIAMGVLQRIQPFRLGYFPSDSTIALPARSSTIPSYVLYAITIVSIVITVIAIETAIAWEYIRMKKAGIPVVLYSIYDYLLVAFFGYVATILITDVGKVAVGRLRPHFFDACGPVPVETTSLGYVSVYRCQKNPEKPFDLMKSFPSGHSSTAIYSAVFLFVYLQLRQPSWCIPAVRVAFQTVFLALGVLTCVTRITDNKHHQTDVLAGAILGFLVALSAPFYMCHLFPSQPNSSVRVLCPFSAKER